MRILIVISACNERASLNQFLPRLFQATRDLGEECDILVVDDGSTDKTGQVARSNGCLVLRNSQNIGIGASLRRGYRKAIKGDYDVVVTMDADGQHSEEFLQPMLTELMKGAEIVKASRYDPSSERIRVPIDRDLLNVAVTAQVRIATGWEISDPLCGFWMMRRKWVEFAIKHGRQTRYGIHLEHIVKFWYLPDVRPSLVEIPHPAIYGNHGTQALLTRQYSPDNQEDRVERFGTHALHLLQALDDVNRLKPGVAETEMAQRRGFK